MGYEPEIIPKSMKNYVKLQLGCLRFSDSYRFLSSGLDKLRKRFRQLTNNDEKRSIDETSKKKLTYPYEYLTLNTFHQPLNLTKEDFWSTLKQSCPSDEKISRTQNSI